MAFHQPTHPPPRAAAPTTAAARPRPRPLAASRDLGVDDSQEWVLFSPSQYQASPTLSTGPTSRTAGLSRLSDFGSLNTIGRTEPEEQEEQDLSEAGEDEDELDSLDDGLHAFREPASPYSGWARRLDQSGGSILPAHDGLGTFTATNAQVQEQLWHHERLNPRRRGHGHYRTLSNVQRRLEALNAASPTDPDLLDDGRLERIQKWRFEQSEILLDELSEAASVPASPHPVGATDDGQLVRASSAAMSVGVNETLWERVRRTVIRNLAGFDDVLLTAILGETVVDEGRRGLETVAEDPSQPAPSVPVASEWETRLIRRIARELDLFVAQWATAPLPRALPAPLDTAHMDYAGMPVVPERREEEVEEDELRLPHRRSRPSAADASAAFHPTLQPYHTYAPDAYASADAGDDDRALADAEREYWEQPPDLRSVFSYLARRFLSYGRASSSITNNNADTPHLPSSAAEYSGASPAAATASAHPPSAHYNHSHHTSYSLATAPSPASRHRAALIQHYHPLVARSRAALDRRRRQSTRRLSLSRSALAGIDAAAAAALSEVAAGPAQRPGSLKRAGTSCASWSTKRSRKIDALAGALAEESEGAGAGGGSRGRNYWDVTGSLGSGSVVGVGGGAGGGYWGEL